MEGVELQKLWVAVVGQLQICLPKSTFNTYLAKSRAIRMENNTLHVVVRNVFHAEYLQKRLSSAIQDAVDSIFKQQLKVTYTVEGSQDANPWAIATIIKRRFNKKMSFANFRQGKCNNAAFKAATAVSESPTSELLNPLYIYGETGMGKTHLLQAIGMNMVQRGESPIYVNSDTFIQQAVMSAQKRTVGKLISKYTNVSAILLDNIGALANKEWVESCLLSILDKITMNSNRIIVSGDMQLSALGLNPKVESRIGSGLSLGITPLSKDVKLELTLDFFIANHIETTDEVVKSIISSKYQQVSKFLGFLNRINALVMLEDQPLTKELIEQISPTSKRYKAGQKEITPDSLIDVIATISGVEKQDIIGYNRTKSATLARWVAMDLLQEKCGLSATRIGKYLSGRTHQSVMYANRKISELKGQNDVFDRILQETEESIENTGE